MRKRIGWRRQARSHAVDDDDDDEEKEEVANASSSSAFVCFRSCVVLYPIINFQYYVKEAKIARL